MCIFTRFRQITTFRPTSGAKCHDFFSVNFCVFVADTRHFYTPGGFELCGFFKIIVKRESLFKVLRRTLHKLLTILSL